jgi:hypothetical protein
MALLKDKNGDTLNIGDYICIKATSYKIDNYPSIGIGISAINNQSIPLDSLKQRYRKKENNQGRIPLLFIDLEKVVKCDEEAYPECFI